MQNLEPVLLPDGSFGYVTLILLLVEFETLSARRPFYFIKLDLIFVKFLIS